MIFFRIYLRFTDFDLQSNRLTPLYCRNKLRERVSAASDIILKNIFDMLRTKRKKERKKERKKMWS